jgi:2-succinyl-5-enolpyruvyl-6-hydroxy-3-cyclohexene-1-carboxylate synthase
VTAPPDQAAAAYLGAFVDELARAGVRHVCVAPGSRSTPLALLIAREPRLRIWMHLDERSAAFFALGMARVLQEPVAVLCTSGSAAANLLPAVVEAARSGVPLLLFTADRPPELRDVGAAQTIDQVGLYGVHAKWSVDVALPETAPALLRYARTLAGRAVALASATPAGPVHLNFPLREPLVPVPVAPPTDASATDLLAWRGRPAGAPWVRVSDAPVAADPETVQRLADRLRIAERPLLICGPQYDETLAVPLAALAAQLGAPLLCDPLSQLRWGGHDRHAIVDRYDAALRHDATATALAPDVVLRFGAVPTSKALLQYLERHGTAASIVVQTAGWSDPSLLACEMVHADSAALCAALDDALRDAMPAHPRASQGGLQPSAWMAAWRRVNDTAATAVARFAASRDEPFEGAALAQVAAAIPSGGTLFVSSSMPVRDLDAFAEGDARHLLVLGNRGANGIDGIVSTALGAAAVAREGGRGPLVLVMGDIAFYHDMNGLLAAKRHALDATIVVINNDGGGIFSFLPQATESDHFEELFGTPHGLEFGPAAALYGALYRRIAHPSELREAIAEGVGEPGGGLRILELRTDRLDNVALHRGAWRAVADALDAS